MCGKKKKKEQNGLRFIMSYFKRKLDHKRKYIFYYCPVLYVRYVFF